MNRIRLLPEEVANQIAAGEVIERPASVVKELVENALDAQATRIQVEIEAGGRSLIRVTDDGVGMSRDDALLCLERHATSKIRTAHDLASIATLGFRGEALPSIASVSRFVLTTRERESDSPEATQLVVHGGKIQSVRAAGAPTGTTVEVRQLFYNLPARRKFLRTEETERAHVQHYLTLAMLAFPSVGFTLIQDQRPLWQTVPIPTAVGFSGKLDSLRRRMRELYGPDLPLLAVDHEHALPTPPVEEAEPAASFRVWGLIGAPGVSRASREDQHLFVNARPVESRGINFALVEGYHTALMKGRYPVCCLFLEVDPAWVDVNVHPAKREVRFREERLVRQGVTHAVRQALLQYHSISVTDPAEDRLPPSSPIPPAPATRGIAPAAPPPVQSDLRLPESVALAPGATPAPNPRLADHVTPAQVGLEPPTPPAQPVKPPVSTSPVPPPSQLTEPVPPLRSGVAPVLAIPLRLVGVVGRLYAVFESDRGMVLMDQHAAHERVLFEQVLGRLQQAEVPSQRLLLPETIELPVRDAHFLREHLKVLERLGVGLSEFGERTFLLDALPPFVKASAPRAFVLELVDALRAAGQEVNSMRLGEETVAKTVCRHAVKANDPLQGRELDQLVEDLRRCAMPYTCPHGRPTLIEMSHRELEKRFGRVA